MKLDNADHCVKLFESYKKTTGNLLCNHPQGTPLEVLINELSFPIASHTNTSIPLFNYANLAMLNLFGMTRSEFIGLESSASASKENQFERAHLLNAVKSHGFIDNYQGYRLRKDGTEFFIKKATIWNVFNFKGELDGQAVIIYDWQI